MTEDVTNEEQIYAMNESELRANLLARFHEERQGGPGGCPVMKPPVEGGGNRDWWPNQPNLKVLQHNPDVINPMAGTSTTPRRCRVSMSTPSAPTSSR